MRKCPQCKGEGRVWVLAPVRKSKVYRGTSIGPVNWDEQYVICRLCGGDRVIEGQDDDDDVGERSGPIADRSGGFFRLAFVGGRNPGRGPTNGTG